MTDNDPAGIYCARSCGRIAPITNGELRGAGGDPSLPIILPVPEGWTPLAELDGMDGEPHEEQVQAVEFDPDQIVCSRCVLAHERDAWHDRLNDAERPPNMTPEEVRAELRAEARDDYRGTAPCYYVIRQRPGGDEETVGFVFYDADSESWRYGWSENTSEELPGVRPEEAIDVALDRLAVQLADG